METDLHRQVRSMAISHPGLRTGGDSDGRRVTLHTVCSSRPQSKQEGEKDRREKCVNREHRLSIPSDMRALAELCIKGEKR